MRQLPPPVAVAPSAAGPLPRRAALARPSPPPADRRAGSPTIIDRASGGRDESSLLRFTRIITVVAAAPPPETTGAGAAPSVEPREEDMLQPFLISLMLFDRYFSRRLPWVGSLVAFA